MCDKMVKDNRHLNFIFVKLLKYYFSVILIVKRIGKLLHNCYCISSALTNVIHALEEWVLESR